MTDRQQLERLMAIVKQSREAQNTYYKGRKNSSGERLKNLLNDARFKSDSLDNLIKQLEGQGYQAVKHTETKADQQNLF